MLGAGLLNTAAGIARKQDGQVAGSCARQLRRRRQTRYLWILILRNAWDQTVGTGVSIEMSSRTTGELKVPMSTLLEAEDAGLPLVLVL